MKRSLIVPLLIIALLGTAWATLNLEGFSVESFSARAQIFRAVGAYADFIDHNESSYYGSPDHPGLINLLLSRACQKFDAWGDQQNELTAHEGQKSDRQLVIDWLKKIFPAKVIKTTYQAVRPDILEAINDFNVAPQSLADLRQLRPIVNGDVPKSFLQTRQQLSDTLTALYQAGFKERPSGFFEACDSCCTKIQRLDSLQHFNNYDYRIIQNNPDLRKTLIWCIDDLIKELGKSKPWTASRPAIQTKRAGSTLEPARLFF